MGTQTSTRPGQCACGPTCWQMALQEAAPAKRWSDIVKFFSLRSRYQALVLEAVQTSANTKSLNRSLPGFRPLVELCQLGIVVLVQHGCPRAGRSQQVLSILLTTKSVSVLWGVTADLRTHTNACWASLHSFACSSTKAALALSSLSQLVHTVCLQEIRYSAGLRFAFQQDATSARCQIQPEGDAGPHLLCA